MIDFKESEDFSLNKWKTEKDPKEILAGQKVTLGLLTKSQQKKFPHENSGITLTFEDGQTVLLCGNDCGFWFREIKK